MHQPPKPRHRVRRATAVAAVVLLSVTAAACGGDDGDTADGTTTTTGGGADDTTSTTAAGSPSSDTTATTAGGDSGGTDGGTPTAPAGPAPSITSFTTPEDIDCHNGDFQEFTASWATTNADRVTISIDGPGVYEEYGANGEASLPFNCSTPHTFLLTAYSADGQTATRSVTLQPRNVQAPDQADQDQ